MTKSATYIIREHWNNETHKGGLFIETSEGRTFDEVVELVWSQYGDQGISIWMVLRLDIDGPHVEVENVSEQVAKVLKARNDQLYDEDRRQWVDDFIDTTESLNRMARAA